VSSVTEGIKQKGPIAYVTLNRPKVLNALSQGADEVLVGLLRLRAEHG
jgi:enoyl-CoA hydratase/carnithine racemase